MTMTLFDVQRKLGELGLYDGSVDGIYGRLTEAAINKLKLLYPQLSTLSVQIGSNKAVGELLRNSDLLECLYPSLPLSDVGKMVADSNLVVPRSDLIKHYGAAGTNQVYAKLPYQMRLAWDLNTIISRFSCHSLVKDKIESIFNQVVSEYTLEGVKELKLDLFGGCFNVRNMRGGNELSMHSWGIAIDLNPAENQLRWDSSKALFARPEYDSFWDIVALHGGVSLGRQKGYDWMHLQFLSI